MEKGNMENISVSISLKLVFMLSFPSSIHLFKSIE